MNKKLVVLLAVLMVMLISVNSTFAVNDPPRITYVLPQVANEIWSVAVEGFNTACDTYGFDCNVVAPTVPNDVSEMNSLIEIAIAEGVDGVMTQAVNAKGQAPAFKKLEEAGIMLALTNSDANDSDISTFLGNIGSELGRIAGEQIVAAMDGEEIRVATALYSISAELAIKIHNAYLGAFEENAGGFEEKIVMDTRSDQLHITEAYQNAFSTYPDINVAINVCGFAAPAAAKAVKEANLVGKVLIMGIDDNLETLDGIRDGVIYGTMTQNFFRMGYEPVMWFDTYFKTGEMPESKANDSGTLFVDMSNIDTYSADMKDPSKW